ncbi:hypothetical protein P7D22_10010 [Lichenihabitans sp. Uapishka_5]|uniref:hypothetical protein n=1 Tax=Lichenihabitans sp. Uapishka_5 TaxID=3037302 RepID=UPI0029E81455|nr:hypothetical protein [Lichenihabitans sp. Uapishka_5]MDX7951501.1 hypothetical protein [Lichenihabitans sp. Uapishka_5]
MALFGVLAFVLGYLAGLRFRVAVVVPLEAAALAGAVVFALTGHCGVGTACWGFLLFSVVLQVGYALAVVCPLPVRRLPGRHTLQA